MAHEAAVKVLTRVWFSSGGMARVETDSNISQVVGQIHFFMVVGPWGPGLSLVFQAWLFGSLSWQREAASKMEPDGMSHNRGMTSARLPRSVDWMQSQFPHILKETPGVDHGATLATAHHRSPLLAP